MLIEMIQLMMFDFATFRMELDLVEISEAYYF